MIDLTISNSTIFLIISLCTIFIILSLSNTQYLVGNYWQTSIEYLFLKVEKEIKDILGERGYKYIPFLISMFIFILMSNVLGLIPYSFTITSHFVITIVFSLSFFIGYTLIGFIRHGLYYLTLFKPAGVPMILLPFIFIIEIVSYISRILSLSLRLSSNMIAGHSILKIISSFGYKLNGLFLILPIIALVALMALETMVAVIQAYIFVVLLATYIKDSEYLH